MTSVQFYLIDASDPAEQYHYALQLAIQQLALGRHLHIHTSSAKATKEIQTLATGKVSASDAKLSISHADEPGSERSVLLNLSNEVPHFFSSFDTMLEIVCKAGDSRDMGRERYRYYRERGYPLRHCDVPSQLAL